MVYGAVSYEKRIKENIKNYKLVNLFPLELLEKYLKDFAGMFGIELLLTDRHGEPVVVIGDFRELTPDVVNHPGVKLRVLNRTIAHLYVQAEQMESGEAQKLDQLVQSTAAILSAWAEQSYMHNEHSIYDGEIEAITKAEELEKRCNEHKDILTGVLNKSYFENRMGIIEHSEIVPIAVINANINDWKFVNDHFGEEESDRLIQIAAKLLLEEAKPEYIIGRTDGDVFSILIPLPEEQEAADYCKRVQEKSKAYEDPILAPSIAMGSVIKTNVEESIEHLMSDAEYEMFQQKLEMKKESGYQVRLHKGT